MTVRRLLVPTLLVVGGCSGPFGNGSCTAELRSTIVVEVTDARTGAPAPIGSTVIVKGAAFYDSVTVTAAVMGASKTAYVAWEDKTAEGRYTVEVRKSGYLDWIKTDVEVKADGCHRGTGPLVTAALQPRT